MKTIFLLTLILLAPSAFAEEESERTSIWLLWGPEAYTSSHRPDFDVNVRPRLGVHVRFPVDIVAGMELTYSEYPYRAKELKRWSWSHLVGYDLVRNRLRLLASLSLVNTNYPGFDDAGSFGFGTKLAYFQPVGERWRLFATLGWEYIAKVRQRHDTSHPSLQKDTDKTCWLNCGSADEMPGRVYDYHNVPATREGSLALGISYAFR